MKCVFRTISYMMAISALSACGQEQDDRPATLEYITLTILAPSCGTATCHSTLSRTAGIVLDSVDEARATVPREGLIRPGMSDGSKLMRVLTGDKDRMPPDGPLPDRDIELIARWIDEGGALQ